MIRRSDVRVIQLADYGGPYTGSFVPMLSAVLGAARARGWRAEAVFPEAARGRAWLPRLEESGARIRFMAADRRSVSALLAEDDGTTVLHTHFTRFDVPAVLAAARRRDTAVFWHEHNDLSPELAVRARNAVKFGLLAHGVDRILCVGPQIPAELRKRGAPRSKLAFFSNGIDMHRFTPPKAEERRAARTALGIPVEAMVLLHYGWSWHTKGGDLFLRAVRLLHDEGLSVTAVSVGGGEPARALAGELGLGGAVLTPDPREDVRDFLAAADLLVSSSRTEGAPLAVAEAHASGLPVVATAIRGHEQGAGLAGRVVVELEPEAIAAGVRALRERTPARLAEDAEADRRWIEEHMGLDGWATRLLALYDEAMAR